MATDTNPDPNAGPVSHTSPAPDTIPVPGASPPTSDTSPARDMSLTPDSSPAPDASPTFNTSHPTSDTGSTPDISSTPDTSPSLDKSLAPDKSPALNPSFVLKEPRQGIIEDGPIPLIRSHTDVIIRIHSRALSAPDVTLWKNGPNVTNGKGHVPGLHATGVVTMVGPRCRRLKEGDRVIFSPLSPCRTCVFCKSDLHNLCPQRTVLGVPPIDGTLQKFCVVPGDLCVILPDSLTFEQGAIVGSYALAFHVCRQANIKPRNSVIIFGENSCAKFCASAAKTFGATRVIRIGRPNYYDMKPTDTPREIAKSILKKNKLSAGSHVVIEASGLDIYMKTGIHILRTGGTFVQVYTTAYGFDRSAEFPLRQACMKDLVFRGARGCLPEDFTASIEILASEGLRMEEFNLKNIYEFEDTQAAFENAYRKIKVNNTAHRMVDASFLISGPRDG